MTSPIILPIFLPNSAHQLAQQAQLGHPAYDSVQQAQVGQPASHVYPQGQPGYLGHSGQIPRQETILPRIFNAMTLDTVTGTWNMDTGLFLSQKKFAVEILNRARMVNCNPSRTPIDTESKLGSDGDPVSDPTLYRSLADLAAYSDADWAGCPTTRRSTSEAEYRGVANAVAETCWVRNLLRELHTPLSSATIVYCDNVSAVYLSSNPVQHQRTKHIEIDIHFVRDLVATGQVRVLHVPSRFQYADIFTKGLPSALFEEFRTSLSVRCPPAPTAGEC
ncbi:ribonuclease H-like domain-containing protein [Tanacetum coccineum]